MIHKRAEAIVTSRNTAATARTRPIMSFLVSPVLADNVSLCCGGDGFVMVDVGHDNDDCEGNAEN